MTKSKTCINENPHGKYTIRAFFKHILFDSSKKMISWGYRRTLKNKEKKYDKENGLLTITLHVWDFNH